MADRRARAEGALACCSDSCSSHYRRHPPSPLLLSPLSDLLIESRPQFPSSFSLFLSPLRLLLLFSSDCWAKIYYLCRHAEIETALPSLASPDAPMGPWLLLSIWQFVEAVMPSPLLSSPLPVHCRRKWRVVSYLSVHSRFMGTRLRRKCRLHHFCPLLSSSPFLR